MLIYSPSVNWQYPVFGCKSLTFIKYFSLLTFTFHWLMYLLGDWKYPMHKQNNVIHMYKSRGRRLHFSYYAKSLLFWTSVSHWVNSEFLLLFRLKVTNTTILVFSLLLIPTSVPEAIMSCFHIIHTFRLPAANSDTILLIAVHCGDILPRRRLGTRVNGRLFGGSCFSHFLATFSLFLLFSNYWTLFKHSGAEIFHPGGF